MVYGRNPLSLQINKNFTRRNNVIQGSPSPLLLYPFSISPGYYLCVVPVFYLVTRNFGDFKTPSKQLCLNELYRTDYVDS